MSSDLVQSVGALAAALEHRYPAEWAEHWDRVGLVLGDPTQTLTGVHVTLDATAEAVEGAVEAGANVLVTHHPPFLTLPERVIAGPGADGTLEAATRLGIAVISLHTNLDRSPMGATALALALGFEVVSPLESAHEPVAVVTTYAPEAAVQDLRAAMAAAGAGRLGPYARCAFTSEGTGWFDALGGARPAVPGDRSGAPEVRVEMVCAPDAVDRVLSAARAAHPYEEPVIVATQGLRARGVARLGRIASWRDSATVQDVAAHVAGTLGCECRVWGDGSRLAGKIAIANGSASSLVGDAVALADTLVAGEVRYHDALAAVAGGCAVIEAGHDCTEWPMVIGLGQVIREMVPDSVAVRVNTARRSWKTVEAAG